MNARLQAWLNTHAGRISRVDRQRLVDPPDFFDMASSIADFPGTVVLASGGEGDAARFHILAAHPRLAVLSRGPKIQMIAGETVFEAETDPFEALELLLDFFQLPEEAGEIPVYAGLFGYLAYDLKNWIEILPRTAVNDLALPDMCLYAPSVIVVHDRREETTWRCLPRWEKTGPEFEKSRKRILEKLSNPPPTGPEDPGPEGGFQGSGALRPKMEKPYYMEAVGRIKAYIRAGDIYQANFAQRFETDFSGRPFALFRQLFGSAPAPFYAYIHAGDHHIVSTSPERFLKQSKRAVETRPIKGTRPRGRTGKADQAMRAALLGSEKDAAELSMIVDLLRNDLGRVAEAGSVRVAEHRRLEAYVNVFHLVSVITGRLRYDQGTVDLIRATFPGGSITGCPRIRAMEIIDELEPCQRHIYTGAIGYISFHQSMDLSVAIRTAAVIGDKLVFSVGGGIVYDSQAADEYEETLHKGRSLADALTSAETDAVFGKEAAFLWANGALVEAAQARLPLSDPGVQYGFGFFETLRVHKGAAAFLDRHMERFAHAWQALFQTPRPDLDWQRIIRRVIRKNRLSDQTAAVKVMATRGSRSRPPYDYQLIVSARPYAGRPAIRENGGLRLATCPHPRQTPLADFKTLNYLYYYLAGQKARERGADEALVLNPDGTVSETHTGNILVMGKDSVLLPESPHVLAGVMQEQVVEELKNRGFGVKSRPCVPAELFSAEAVLITNSLIGVVPALCLDGRGLGERYHELCRELCRQVL